MPTFFFDIANHKLVQRDHQGRELASLDAARAAGDAELRNWIGDRRLNGGHWLEIRDSNGTLLARLDPQPGIALSLSEPPPNDTMAATPPAQGDLLLAITALRRTLARLAAHGEDDAEDSEILELLTAAYAERMAARISHAALARS